LKDIQAGNAALYTKYHNSQQPPPIITNKTGLDSLFNEKTFNEY